MAGQSNQQAHTAHHAGPRAARDRADAAARVARAALAGCLAACFALPVHAKYDVDIDAPRSIRKLLKTHLDIARFAKRDDISDDQFDFLVTATPQQVRDLTATAGYFSPVVRTDVRTRDGKRDVRIAVDPGKQTVVSTVDLTFKGPVET
ncbi:membrane protein, partial [Burkholderia cenocepacia]